MWLGREQGRPEQTRHTESLSGLARRDGVRGPHMGNVFGSEDVVWGLVGGSEPLDSTRFEARSIGGVARCLGLSCIRTYVCITFTFVSASCDLACVLSCYLLLCVFVLVVLQF